MSDDSQDVYRAGLDAVDALDLDAAKAALAKVSDAAGESSIQVLHLTGMIAWASGDLEHAAGYLMQAADAGPTEPDVYLDCAELELELGELDEAEAAIRVMLGMGEAPPEKADEGRLLLAQIRRFDDDPDEALEILDEIESAVREHPYYHSARATVLLELDRAEEALAEMERAVEAEPEDPDLHWELGVAASAAGDEVRSRAAMLRTWELDVAEGGERSEPSADERADLSGKLEGVMEDLPDELLKFVAGARIDVAAAATREQVEGGADPRNALIFSGTPATDDADAELGGIVVLRDVLVDMVEEDDEIPEVLFQALMVEMRRFFRLEQLTVVNVGA